MASATFPVLPIARFVYYAKEHNNIKERQDNRKTTESGENNCPERKFEQDCKRIVIPFQTMNDWKNTVRS